MIPLKDDIPTRRFPIVTLVLIAINVLVYFLLRTGPVGPGRRGRRARATSTAPSPTRSRILARMCRGPPTRRPSGSRSSPRCSSTAACSTWRATCCSCGSSATTSRTRWAALTLHRVLPARRRSRRSGSRWRWIRIRPSRPSAPSGAIAAVLGAYARLYPRARVVTLRHHHHLLHRSSTLPALLVLGLWFLLQLAARVQRAGRTARGGGVAYFAHIGGFVFGRARDQAVRKPRPRGLRPATPYPCVLMGRTLALAGKSGDRSASWRS